MLRFYFTSVQTGRSFSVFFFFGGLIYLFVVIFFKHSLLSISFCFFRNPAPLWFWCLGLHPCDPQFMHVFSGLPTIVANMLRMGGGHENNK